MAKQKITTKLYINLKSGEQFEIGRYNAYTGDCIEMASVVFHSLTELPPKVEWKESGKYTAKLKRYLVNADFPVWVQEPFIVDAHQRVEVVGRNE